MGLSLKFLPSHHPCAPLVPPSPAPPAWTRPSLLRLPCFVPTDPLQMLSRSPPVASAPVLWLPCSLSNYRATLPLFTSHLWFSVLVHLPSLLGHERGSCPAVEHLNHLAQCIAKQRGKKRVSPRWLFRTVRRCVGMGFKARSQAQHSGKQLASGQQAEIAAKLYSPFTRHKTFPSAPFFQ